MPIIAHHCPSLPIYAQRTIFLNKTQHPYFSGLIPNFWLLSYKSTRFDQFVFCLKVIYSTLACLNMWNTKVIQNTGVNTQYWHIYTDHNCDDWFTVQHKLQPMSGSILAAGSGAQRPPSPPEAAPWLPPARCSGRLNLRRLRAPAPRSNLRGWTGGKSRRQGLELEMVGIC